jgi:cytochrome P450
MTYQGSIVENTYIAPAYGLVEYIKRARHDYMSIYTPEMHDRSLLHFKRGFSNTFLVNKPEYIEHVFLTNQQNYLKTPLAQPLLPPYLGVTLLTSEGEYWRRQRRTAAPAFQPRRVGDFIETMAACTGAMLQEWEKRGERPFDVVKQMTDLTLQIIARAMFSTDVSGEIETLTRMRHVVDEELKISVFDLLGLPQWLPRPVSKRALDSLEAFRDLVGRILEARRDLMSMLLAARDPDTGEGMTDAELKREMLMMLLAGHDTVSTTLSIAWYLLAQHPEVEQKLHEEIDRVLGGRRPVASDLAHLRYTRMVFEETMQDRRGPRAGRITDDCRALRHSSQSQPLAGSRAFRSGTLHARGDGRSPALFLYAVRRRPSYLHRHAFRHRRGADRHRDDCSAFSCAHCA